MQISFLTCYRADPDAPESRHQSRATRFGARRSLYPRQHFGSLKRDEVRFVHILHFRSSLGTLRE